MCARRVVMLGSETPWTLGPLLPPEQILESGSTLRRDAFLPHVHMSHPSFSARTRWPTSSAAAHPLSRTALDLADWNPANLALDTLASVEAALGVSAPLSYAPDPRGLLAARRAVVHYYRERGIALDPAQVFLTASTSEAYAWLFKLLCDPEDCVAIPTPSYPLFDYLAQLEGVRTAAYPLLREEGFRVDMHALHRVLEAHAPRAVVVVAPNNPTGTLVHEEDALTMDALAAERGAALLVDEVFGDYLQSLLSDRLRRTFAGTACQALTFVLSGLSKVCCAPGLKLGWIIVQGPDALVAAASERLEIIADTYLSVATPVQLALSNVLAQRGQVQAEVAARLAKNRATLQSLCAQHELLRLLPSHGGWTALLEIPRIMDEDAWVRLLAEQAGVRVQPGYFYDLTDGGTLALSLLVEPKDFERGARALAKIVTATAGV